MQDFVTHIQWHCPACAHLNDQEISVPELNFAAEKSSDMTVNDAAALECEGCDTVYGGQVWVYPSGVEFEIEEPYEFSVQGDMPMYGPDDDYEPPTDPHSIARESFHQLAKMVGTAAPETDPQFTNRLVFSGAVSSLEAYLGDTLINAVRNEADVRDELLKNNAKLGSLSISAAELASTPNALNQRVVSELRNILFHNLEVVNVLYRDAFGIRLFPSNSERDILFPAMLKRHDCVHRNGCDRDGNKITEFTDVYVHQVIAAIAAVVDHIEEERDKRLPF
mgnify:CR=1 FL=1